MHTVIVVAHDKVVGALHRPTIAAVTVSHRVGRRSYCPCTLLQLVLPPLAVVGAALKICMRTQPCAHENLVAFLEAHVGVRSLRRIGRRVYCTPAYCMNVNYNHHRRHIPTRGARSWPDRWGCRGSNGATGGSRRGTDSRLRAQR